MHVSSNQTIPVSKSMTDKQTSYTNDDGTSICQE